MIWFIVLGLLVLFYKPIKDGLQDGYNGTRVNRSKYIPEPPKDPETERLEAVHAEKIAAFDKLIDGYQNAIKLLNIAYQTETDEKKKAAVLVKMLVTIEKQNKIIEQREKLE